MTALSEWASKARLGDAVLRPREVLSTTIDEALELQRGVGGRVVAKASGVAHKSTRGLVRVDLDASALRACWAELAAAGDGRVLVAEQLTGELELLLGGLRDPVFGPVVTVGRGGEAAEVDPDAVFLLAPVEPGELEQALRRLRAAQLLFGFRGRPRVDLHALERALGAVARLLDDPDVVEVDCNPVLVSGGRPWVLDALVILADGRAADSDRGGPR